MEAVVHKTPIAATVTATPLLISVRRAPVGRGQHKLVVTALPPVVRPASTNKREPALLPTARPRCNVQPVRLAEDAEAAEAEAEEAAEAGAEEDVSLPTRW